MAATIGAQTTTPINSVPTVRLTQTLVTMDASYPTNGLAVTAAQLGLSAVNAAICNVKTNGANGPISAWYDTAAGKIKCNAATGEVANATDLSAAIIHVTAWGQ